MLESMQITNFTAFSKADLRFSEGLNVVVGENGTGKTHLLKLPYAVMALSSGEGRKRNGPPTKKLLKTLVAEKIHGVFRPEAGIGRLARRWRRGRTRCEVNVTFRKRGTSLGFSFATQHKSEVVIDDCPSHWCESSPVFLPTRELLTIYPGFISLYENYLVEFEETWRDTCLLLGAPALKNLRADVAKMLEPLETQLGGHVILERNDRFYLQQRRSLNMEMPLVAEGWRKVGMLARLISTGSLLDNDCLFWDEPESNLNPRLIREVARAILHICAAGVQVFVATHSLFLLREFEILLKQQDFREVKRRFFALQRGDGGVAVSQADDVGDVEPLLLLDEELMQSDRFVEEFSQGDRDR